MIDLIRYLSVNPVLVFLPIALVFALFLRTGSAPERLARALFLFPFGIGRLAACARVFFFYEETNSLLGLDPEHFQYKIGLADLGLGIASLLAFRKSFSFCLGTAVFAFIFLGGIWIGRLLNFLAGLSPVESFWTLGAKSFLLLLLAASLIFWHRKKAGKA